MSGRRRRGSRALIIVTVLLVILAIGVYLFTRDDPPPDDAHLRITYENIPDEENAFTYFNQAAEALDWPEEGEDEQRAEALLDDDGWDEALAADLLARNEGVLELIDRGLACPHCQVPEMRDWEDFLPELAPWRAISKLGAIRAELLLRQGKEREAFKQTMDLVRFGHCTQHGRGSIIHYLAGMAIKRTGLGQLRHLLGRTTLERDALTPYIDQLSEYRGSARGLADAFRGEYACASWLIAKAARTEYILFGRFVFKPNRTRRLFADALTMLIDKTDKPYTEASSLDLNIPEYGSLRTIKGYLSGNVDGKGLFRSIMGSSLRVQVAMYRSDSSVGATQILIALKCYTLEHGELPNTLNELVPEYFDAVPLDDFDGQPVRYSKEKGVLYSIGKDLVDSGGADETASDADEPTIKIAF